MAPIEGASRVRPAMAVYWSCYARPDLTKIASNAPLDRAGGGGGTPAGKHKALVADRLPNSARTLSNDADKGLEPFVSCQFVSESGGGPGGGRSRLRVGSDQKRTIHLSHGGRTEYDTIAWLAGKISVGLKRAK